MLLKPGLVFAGNKNIGERPRVRNNSQQNRAVRLRMAFYAIRFKRIFQIRTLYGTLSPSKTDSVARNGLERFCLVPIVFHIPAASLCLNMSGLEISEHCVIIPARFQFRSRRLATLSGKEAYKWARREQPVSDAAWRYRIG
jgi:hypothetical protein